MMLSPLQWRIIKLVGYPAFFLLCFAAFVLWTFPVDRFAPQLEDRLSSMLGREVSIGEVSMSLTGGFTLEAVEIGVAADEEDRGAAEAELDGAPTKRDEKPGQAAAKPVPPLKYTIEEIDIDVGFIDLLLGELDVEVDADLLGGELSVAYEGPIGGSDREDLGATPGVRRPGLPRRGLRNPMAGRGQAESAAASPGDGPQEGAVEGEAEPEEEGDPMSLTIEATGIQLRQIHDLRRKIPVPVVGTLDLSVEVSSASGRFADAEGRISVAAKQLKVGDSKNPASIGGMPLTVDEVAVSELTWEIEVKAGIGTVDKFVIASTDFDAKIEGTITFGDPFSRSRLDLYFTFKFLEGYKKKSATASMLVGSLPDLSSSFRRALRSDGYFGFRYRGMIGAAQFVPSKVFRGKAGRDGERPDRRLRRPLAGQDRRGAESNRPPAGQERSGQSIEEAGRSMGEQFPDMKPPIGSGRFGVDPVPPPVREATPEPEDGPAEGEVDLRGNQRNAPREEVEEQPEPPPQEQPEVQPEEQPEDQPEDQPEEQPEDQGQEQVEQ